MNTEEFMKILDMMGMERSDMMELLELKGLKDDPEWKELNLRIDTAFRVAAEKMYPKCIIPFDAEVDIVEDMSGAFVSAYIWVPRHDE